MLKKVESGQKIWKFLYQPDFSGRLSGSPVHPSGKEVSIQTRSDESDSRTRPRPFLPLCCI